MSQQLYVHEIYGYKYVGSLGEGINAGELWEISWDSVTPISEDDAKGLPRLPMVYPRCILPEDARTDPDKLYRFITQAKRCRTAPAIPLEDVWEPVIWEYGWIDPKGKLLLASCRGCWDEIWVAYDGKAQIFYYELDPDRPPIIPPRAWVEADEELLRSVDI